MDDSSLCDFCYGLVFWDKAEFMHHKCYRTLEELRRSVQTTACPFCKAFHVGILGERPDADADADTRCKFRLDTSHDGFIQLTISFCRPMLGARVPNGMLRDWDAAGLDTYLEQICYWMIAYAETEKPEAWERFHNRPDWQSGKMDIARRFGSIDRWLEDCVSNQHGAHKTCFDVKIPGYPRRLLDLDGFETSGQVRLVDTIDWLKPFPEYTTLSHCWGPPTGPRPLRTLSTKIASHQTGILMQDLPRTFQDAVRITHRVGKKLLWIDSLAIIQDDMDDWRSEAAQMAAIYENSFMTIAATTSENCQGGCDLEPWDLDIIKAKARTGPGEFRDILSETRYEIKLKRTNASWLGGTRLLLHTRGWVLQEAVLSRRILHMASHHMLWQCREHFDYEDANARSSGNAQLTVNLVNVGFQWDRYPDEYNHRWWALVKNYSKQDLTYPADKLPAVAGIVQSHSVELDDIPLLGLWKKDLARNLGWRCDEEQASTIPGIPTWTWLSSRGEIKGPINLVPDATSRLLTEGWSIDWESQPYVSKLKKGMLKVRSKIFETTLKESDDAIRDNFRRVLMHPFSDGYKADPNCVLEYHSDIIMTANTTRDMRIAYLLLYTRIYLPRKALKVPRKALKGSEYVVFLALRPAPNDPSTYLRIGCGAASVDTVGNTEANVTSRPFGSGFIDHVLRDWRDATIQLC